jgi:hypothetical protein
MEEIHKHHCPECQTGNLEALEDGHRDLTVHIPEAEEWNGPHSWVDLGETEQIKPPRIVNMNATDDKSHTVPA